VFRLARRRGPVRCGRPGSTNRKTGPFRLHTKLVRRRCSHQGWEQHRRVSARLVTRLLDLNRRAVTGPATHDDTRSTYQNELRPVTPPPPEPSWQLRGRRPCGIRMRRASNRKAVRGGSGSSGRAGRLGKLEGWRGSHGIGENRRPPVSKKSTVYGPTRPPWVVMSRGSNGARGERLASVDGNRLHATPVGARLDRASHGDALTRRLEIQIARRPPGEGGNRMSVSSRPPPRSKPLSFTKSVWNNR